MTFPSILPYLQAGRKVRRLAWPAGRWTERHVDAPLEVWRFEGSNSARCCCDVDFADLLSSDWELLDEPAQASTGAAMMFDGTRHTVLVNGVLHELSPDGTVSTQAATITRLTRELAEARKTIRDGRRIHSLTLRLDDGTEVVAQLTAIKALP